MMFGLKRKCCHFFVPVCIIFMALIIQATFVLSSDEITSSIATTTTENDVDIDKKTSTVRMPREVNEATEEVQATTPNVILQPNIAGALDVDHGLLVPLVPVVDANSKVQTTQASPFVANLIPVTQDENNSKIRRSAASGIDEDMDVAEDIVFRPLFRYRQEAQRKLTQKKYYQPYIYAIKPRSNNSPRQYDSYNNYN